MDSSLELPPLNITTLLRSHQLSPKKSLGQNFLVDAVALKRVVAAAGIQPGEDVLEIGPGLGSLTRYLAQAARRVFAVEIDQNLIPILQEVVAPYQNVNIIHQDILETNLSELLGEEGDPYRVIANIPYYITSAVIRHLLESRRKPRQLVLTIQREVAERICARSGAHSLLSLSVQVYGTPTIAARIPAGAFYPAPNVDSSVLRVDLFPQPFIPDSQIDTFFRLAKAGFGQKRKTLRNALSAGLSQSTDNVLQLLQASGIDPQRRAETLSLDEWKIMVEQFEAIKRG